MLPVIHFGLGAIGKATLDAILAQPRQLKLVAAVDLNPAHINHSLREVLNRRDAPNILVAGSLKDALKSAKNRPVVASVTTCSRTEDIRPTAGELLAAGIHAATTCEELAWPTLRAPRIAAALDRLAVKKGVALLGTGVNPGFAMDAFALACTAPCTRVRHIKIIRSLDASKRRFQLQKKIGAGMSLADVKKLIRQKAIGHVGLQESVAMIAAGLGWKLDAIQEKFEAVVADHPVQSEFYHIEPGKVRGMWMRANGIVGGKKRIELDLFMAFDADTFDEVIIDGDPNLLVRTKSGFPGEAATVGLLVNSLRVLPTLKPGLRTMLDVLKIRSVGA
ncbi:MAG TPA: dihydrodipicolinate reductase [Phycisphaerae bacterium]|nr:dihydrodipicolinate reductase [Phycisphaerae bacterium]